MKITRFAHAAVLVEAADKRIPIDPGTFSGGDTFALTGLAAIVITHQHGDHVDTGRLPQLLGANPDAIFGGVKDARQLGQHESTVVGAQASNMHLSHI